MSRQAVRDALEDYRATLPPDSPLRTAPWAAEGERFRLVFTS